jgi:hypothetical protein
VETNPIVKSEQTPEQRLMMLKKVHDWALALADKPRSMSMFSFIPRVTALKKKETKPND